VTDISLWPPKGRKTMFLPQIAQLALEGHSNRAISRKTGVPRRTVDRWLLQQRSDWSQKSSEVATDMFSLAIARLQSAYREAMEAWRRSQEDRRVRLEQLRAADADERKQQGKTSLCTESQSGQAALLGKAVQAAIAICEFNNKHLDAQQQSRYLHPQRDLIELAEELENLSPDELGSLKTLLQADSASVRSLIEDQIRAQHDPSSEDNDPKRAPMTRIDLI
jgi:hypothetical protein